MLTDRPSKSLSLAYLLLACLQLVVMSQYGLFADEAFYWLEGQHLDWSYAELPGWTAWILALSEWLFPHHPFFLRLLPWLAAISIPWLALAINRMLHKQHSDMPFGLVWALPLTGLVSVLALPDVWLLFFAFATVYLALGAIKHNRKSWYIGLGIVVACALNVHVRYWFFAFILAAVMLVVLRCKGPVVKQLLVISLPLALMGLIPVLIFNLQHDFPLLTFQLKDRHPWQFQFGHLWFFVIQCLVCTPLVFFLWAKSALNIRSLEPPQKIVVIAALCHWLMYAVLGFFSDNLRFNLHWPLLSYGLIFATVLWHKTTFNTITLWSGLGAHAALLLTIIYWQHQDPPSQFNNQIANHAWGGQTLADKTREVMVQHKKKRLVADQFMTAATLQYHMPNHDIMVLPHTLNDKHGRAPQLALMGMSLDETANRTDLIVIEQTALKLQQQPQYYQNLCEQQGGIEWLDQLDIKQGGRIYLFFKVGTGHCDLPAMFYSETHDNQITGWVLTRIDQQNIELRVHSTTGTSTIEARLHTIQGNEMFDGLDGKRYGLLYFEHDHASTLGSHQLSLQTPNNTQYSQRFY